MQCTIKAAQRTNARSKQGESFAPCLVHPFSLSLYTNVVQLNYTLGTPLRKAVSKVRDSYIHINPAYRIPVRQHQTPIHRLQN